MTTRDCQSGKLPGCPGENSDLCCENPYQSTWLEFERIPNSGMINSDAGKPTNPKDIVGAGKLPLELIPDTALAHASLAFLDGALKYGRFNWRVAGVRSSIYVAAMRRHLAMWFNGEDLAPDSGAHHLAHVIACAAILLDAEAYAMLEDDRAPRPALHLSMLVEELTKKVRRLTERHRDKNPKHYTIQSHPGWIDLNPAGGALTPNGEAAYNTLLDNMRPLLREDKEYTLDELESMLRTLVGQARAAEDEAEDGWSQK